MKNLLTTLTLLLIPLLLSAQIYEVSRRITLTGSDTEELFRATISITSTHFVISLGPVIYFRSRIVDCRGDFNKKVELTCGNSAEVVYSCYGEFNGVFLVLDKVKYYYDNHTPTSPPSPNSTHTSSKILKRLFQN